MAKTAYSTIARARGVVWCATLLILVSAMALCCKRHEESAGRMILHRADSALIADADTLALGILTAMEDSIVDALSEEDRALYAVLVNQALDRNDYAVDDSLAQAAAYYYLNNNVGDDYHEGLAYYYMGHSLKENMNQNASEWYKLSQRLFVRIPNLRYGFLSTYYEALMYFKSMNVKKSIDSYLKSLNMAQELSNDRYEYRAWAGLASSYSYIGNVDSAHICIEKAQSFPLDALTKAYLYTSMCRLSLLSCDYNCAINYCDSAILYSPSDSAVINTLRVDALLGLDLYNKAKKCCMSIKTDDIYLNTYISEQLVKIYMNLAEYDSARYYTNVQSQLRDSLYILNASHNAANYLLDKKTTVVSHDYTYMHVIAVVILSATVTLLFYRGKRKRENVVDCSEIPEKLEVLNREIKKIINDRLKTDVQCKSEVYSLINHVLPKSIDEILNSNSKIDEEDVLCVICVMSNLSYAEIGRLLSMTRSGAFKRVKRACDKLDVAISNTSPIDAVRLLLN